MLISAANFLCFYNRFPFTSHTPKKQVPSVFLRLEGGKSPYFLVLPLARWEYEQRDTIMREENVQGLLSLSLAQVQAINL
jgi:hypothetical protein